MKIRMLNLEYPDNPQLSMATEEAIFINVINGKSPNTFRFYRHRNAVILGCFQLASQEVDEDFSNSKNISIVKRVTGGGAVYHDMGNLNFSIIANDKFGIGNDVPKLYSTMMQGALQAFKNIGINSQPGKLNDVSVANKKILGAAATIRSGSLLFHACVLVDVNLTTLASSLKVPGIKLKDKGVATVLERVTNVKAISGKDINEVKEALLNGYSQTLNLEFEIGDLTKEESELAKRLYESKYNKNEWNMGREIIDIHYE